MVSFSLSYTDDDQRVLLVVDQVGEQETEQEYVTRTLTEGSEAYTQAVSEILTRRPDLAIFFDEVPSCSGN